MKKFILVMILVGMTAAFVLADSFFIRNGTGDYDFYFIYVSDSRLTEWGRDLLGRDTILEPGEILRVNTPIPIGSTTWDIRIIDEDGDSYTFWNRRIRSGETIVVTLDDLD